MWNNNYDTQANERATKAGKYGSGDEWQETKPYEPRAGREMVSDMYFSDEGKHSDEGRQPYYQIEQAAKQQQQEGLNHFEGLPQEVDIKQNSSDEEETPHMGGANDQQNPDWHDVQRRNDQDDFNFDDDESEFARHEN